MEPDGYNYSTQDIRSMYGMSVNGLKFFEEKNIISPRRASGNGYRVFTMTECSRLFRYRILRRFGFSVDECTALFLDAQADRLCAQLAARRATLEEEIRRAQAICTRMAKTESLIEASRKVETFDVQMCPEMLRLELVGGGGMHGSSCDNSKDFQRWFECLPFSAASICVDRATLLAGHGRLKVNLGFIIEASEAEKNGLYAGRYAQWLSARRCLHGIVRGSDDEPADPARFFPALDKLNALGLSLSGDPFTRMIGSYDVGDGLLRYDEAWFPIDEMMSR